MPTSVLLAVLAVAGLLALAPALTRRHDAAEGMGAERATSTARVLTRRRRHRTVPGRRPVNPPSWVALAAHVPQQRGRVARSRRGRARARTIRRRRAAPTALHRRRRVLLALVALNLVELTGAILVGPGFWVGFIVSFGVLLADLIYLRHRAVVAARRHAAQRRRRAWIAAEQAAVRRQQARRAAERRSAHRVAAAARETTRRRAPTEYVERYARPAAPRT